MKLTRPDLAAYGLVALCVLAIAALAVLGKPAPDVLQYLAVTALGIGGGVALQTPTAQTAQLVPLEVPSRAAAPVNNLLNAPRSTPAGYTDDPAATGVFRAATHAP